MIRDRRSSRKGPSAPVAWLIGLVIGGLLGVGLGYALDSVVAGGLIGVGLGIAVGVFLQPDGERDRRS